MGLQISCSICTEEKVLYGQIRKFLGPLFHDLASHRSCKILEGHMVQDHVHMLIAIPPKYSVSEVIGYIKGKSAALPEFPWYAHI